MLNSGIFWGIMVVIFGLVLIIKHIFNLEIPVFKVMIGIFLVLLGVNFLLDKKHHFSFSDKDSVVFGSKTIDYEYNRNEYNAVFSDVTVDLTDIEHDINKTLELNAVFSDMKVLLNDKTKVKLKSDVVFGNIENPEDEVHADKNDSLKSNPSINIKAAAVFGNLKFIRQ